MSRLALGRRDVSGLTGGRMPPAAGPHGPVLTSDLVRAATAALIAALCATHVNLEVLGLPAQDGPSSREWLLRIVLWVVPFGLLALHSDGVLRVLFQPPLLWRTLMLLWALITVPFAERPVFALFNATVVLCAIGLPAWYATRVGWRRFLDAMAVSVGVLLAASLLTGVVDGSVALMESSAPVPRLKGVLTHANQVGQFAGVAVLLAWHYRAIGRRRASLLLGALGGSALLWSQSRTALGALALALGWAMLRQGGRSARLRGLVAALVVVVFVASVGVSNLALSVSRSNSTTEITTLTGRTSVWSGTLQVAGERPLTGHGYGTEALQRARANALINWDAQSTHSDWLQWYLVIGVPGVLLWLAMWVSYVLHARRRPDTMRDALMILVLALGWTESAMGPVFPSFVQYVLAGCLASVGIEARFTFQRSIVRRTGPYRLPTSVPYSSKAYPKLPRIPPTPPRAVRIPA